MRLAVLAALLGGTAWSQVQLNGRVVDENNAAVPGALVVLRRAGASLRMQAVADPAGRIAFRLDAAGEYLLTAEREGFFRVEDRPVALAAGANEITLVLNPAREVFEKIDVSYSPPAIDFDRAAPQQRVTGTELIEIPFPSTNTLRNALRTVPGVVQDSAGDIHVNGGEESQVLYTLDGFRLNDPLSGRLESRVSVESVRSLEVTGLGTAEFGKGAAGTLAIKTAAGDDQFRYSGTNFVPGVENRKGLTIGGWTPRFNLSGPIKKGRAWFSDSLDLQFDNTIVDELPKGEDRTSSWRIGNLLRSQVNVTGSNTLHTGFLTTFRIAPRNGLGVMAPESTTLDRRQRQWFFNVRDQATFSGGMLFEIGYAANRTFSREIPQGHGVLLITPDGDRGNRYWDAIRHGGRDELLASLSLRPFRALGAHQVKAGVEFSAVNYRQDVRRTGYVFLRADSTWTRRVAFAGSGRLGLSNSEGAWFVQDSWRIRPSVLAEIGLRQDWNRLTGGRSAAPRTGFSWAPPRLEATRLFAGHGWILESPNLEQFSRPHDQRLLTTRYPGGAPAVSQFVLETGLKTPRYESWDAGAEQRFPAELYARLQYTGRRGGDGLAYLNTLPDGTPGFDGLYELRNVRRDRWDGLEVTLRQTFRKQYEWMASYTRSRSRSSVVLQPDQENPLLVASNGGPLPWDSPHRFLGWGYLPTWWSKWAVAYLVEARSGFPFSVTDETGKVLGAVNDHRLPVFFELNLHLERRFVFRNNRWALRFGFNNITNHRNPNEVVTDAGSPHFLATYGGQSRAFNLRIRWLGK